MDVTGSPNHTTSASPPMTPSCNGSQRCRSDGAKMHLLLFRGDLDTLLGVREGGARSPMVFSGVHCCTGSIPHASWYAPHAVPPIHVRWFSGPHQVCPPTPYPPSCPLAPRAGPGACLSSGSSGSSGVRRQRCSSGTLSPTRPTSPSPSSTWTGEKDD